MTTLLRQQGFGCMGFSAFYSSSKSTTEAQAIEVLTLAYSKGVNILSTATIYGELNEIGFGHNLRLLKKFLESPGIERSKVILAVKIGMDTRCPVEKTGTFWNMRGDYESLKADVDYCLDQLNTDYLDIIILNRVDPKTPIEESALAMKRLVDEGKARFIGLSEASATTLRKACAVTQIHFIEQEWSLFARDIEVDILPTCRELGIKILAYSPLGRGFLTGAIKSRDDIDPSDFRAFGQPKFSAENFDKNFELVRALSLMAEKKGVTPGQIALAWLHSQGEDVIPIPGTSKISNLVTNIDSLNIFLTETELQEIDRICDPKKVTGDRYAYNHLT